MKKAELLNEFPQIIMQFVNKRKIAIISLNNTETPRTGGEYVYHVIKNTLQENGYFVKDHSLPRSIYRIPGRIPRIILTPFLYIWYIAISLWKHYLTNEIVITSASPAFPLFGDITYHQPKASINTGNQTNLSLYEKIAMKVHENEILSPLWYFAKKTHTIHISNSNFTKKIIKELYGIQSTVIYPPVELKKYLKIDLSTLRQFSLLVVRPRGITGINNLTQIIQKIPKNTPINIIGHVDEAGKNTIERLTLEGYNIKYHGYVSETKKTKLLSENSHYLHLAQNEAFGITVIESMVSGCIPVAPNNGGIPEYLPPEYRYNNSLEAQQILLNKQLSDPEEKMKLRKIAKKYDKEEFQRQILEIIKKYQN